MTWRVIVDYPLRTRIQIFRTDTREEAVRVAARCFRHLSDLCESSEVRERIKAGMQVGKLEVLEDFNQHSLDGTAIYVQQLMMGGQWKHWDEIL